MSNRILVVDDNPTNLKLLCEVLESDGFDVERAMDGTEALECIGRQEPDLILMDIAMPGIDGLTLTRLLKDDNLRRHIPIIIVTASAMKGDSNKAIAAGCDDYITKPVDLTELRRKIAMFVPNQR